MKTLHQYGTLKNFIEDLEKSPTHYFPFKVMGQKRLPTKKQPAIFQSASTLAEVYRKAMSYGAVILWRRTSAAFRILLFLAGSIFSTDLTIIDRRGFFRKKPLCFWIKPQ